MAGRPKNPLALQVASGRDQKNPQRYREAKKNEPSGLDGVGDPPAYIQDTPECKARAAWRMFSIEIPWLTESDRAMLEAACLIRGDIIAGQAVGVPRLTLLRGILQSMGATPADRAKIAAAGSKDGEEKEEDIFSEG